MFYMMLINNRENVLDRLRAPARNLLQGVRRVGLYRQISKGIGQKGILGIVEAKDCSAMLLLDSGCWVIPRARA